MIQRGCCTNGFPTIRAAALFRSLPSSFPSGHLYPLLPAPLPPCHASAPSPRPACLASRVHGHRTATAALRTPPAGAANQRRLRRHFLSAIRIMHSFFLHATPYFKITSIPSCLSLVSYPLSSIWRRAPWHPVSRLESSGYFQDI